MQHTCSCKATPMPPSQTPPCCSCLKEIQCLAGMPAHRHIVGHYRAWQEAGHFYIQMDLCEHGTLAQLIHLQVGPWLPADQSAQVLVGCCVCLHQVL